jgi:Asp-tRNA(Asn)/Glu-tRNA(Gln) amidotransferase B subunit
MVIAELRTCVHTLQEDQASRAACIAELEALIREDKIDGEVGKDIIEKLQKSGEPAAQVIEKYTR